MANYYAQMEGSDDVSADDVAAVDPGSPAADNIYAAMEAQQQQAPRWRPARGSPPTDPALPAITPINRALDTRNQEIATYQSQQQRDYEERWRQRLAYEKEHPEARTPDWQLDEVPAQKPDLDRMRPPLAPREENPSQEMGSGFGATAKSDLVADPKTKRKILAANLFPNDPDGINRVGFDVSGQPVYVGDDGKLHRIASRTASLGANFLANSPETVSATAASILGPWWASPLAAGAAHAGKRYVASQIYDEPVTAPQIAGESAVEAGATLLGEGMGRGIAALGNRGRVYDFTPQQMAAGEQLRERVLNNTGINLDIAQATGDRRLISMRAYLDRYPGPSSNLIQAADEANKGELHAATDRVLNTIANATPAEVAGEGGINAAKMTIDLARKQSQARVDPLYKAAYDAAPAVVDPKVISFFRHPEFRQAYREGQTIQRLEEKQARPVVATTTTYAPNVPPMSVNPPHAGGMWAGNFRAPASASPKPPGLTIDQPRLGHEAPPPGTNMVPAGAQPGHDVMVVNSQGQIVPQQAKYQRTKVGPNRYSFTKIVEEEEMRVPDLRGLDYTKRGLDQMIDNLMASGKRNEARALAIQRDAFRGALDNLDIPQYKQARDAWKNELQTKIDPLENGVVGVLSRIDDPQASQAAARIFSDPNLTPTMVQDAKRAIQKHKPEAWNELTRTWVAHEWDLAQKVTQTGEELNAAGKIHQRLFGTPRMRANTMEMLDPQAAQIMEEVMLGASKLASTPRAGSNTFRDTEIGRILTGITGAGFKVWQALTGPRQFIKDVAERRAMEQNAVKITQGILDPKKRKQLRVIMRMQPSTQRTIVLMNVLGAQMAKDYVQSGIAQGPDSHLVVEEESGE